MDEYERGVSEQDSRGSRKHILDWTSRPEFCEELQQLVKPLSFRIPNWSQWMPEGYQNPEEARLEIHGPKLLPVDNDWSSLTKWWLAHPGGANTPNWDIAVGCEIKGRRGLILVEAKAHEKELKEKGKTLPSNASHGSRENHDKIGGAIAEACEKLDKIIPGVHISRDQNYQLSNRVAFSWKLASEGIPVLLVYLGFTGDTGIEDLGPYLQSLEHWQTVMHNHTKDILPEMFFERWLPCGKSEMCMIVRSRQVIEPTPL